MTVSDSFTGHRLQLGELRLNRRDVLGMGLQRLFDQTQQAVELARHLDVVARRLADVQFWQVRSPILCTSLTAPVPQRQTPCPRDRIRG